MGEYVVPAVDQLNYRFSFSAPCWSNQHHREWQFQLRIYCSSHVFPRVRAANHPKVTENMFLRNDVTTFCSDVEASIFSAGVDASSALESMNLVSAPSVDSNITKSLKISIAVLHGLPSTFGRPR